MSSFTDPLIVEPLPDGRQWRLVEEFTFWTRVQPSKGNIRKLNNPKAYELT